MNTSLEQVRKNKIATIKKINIQDEKLAEFLKSLGFVENAKIKVLDYSFFRKNMLIKIIQSTYILDISLAEKIMVDYD